MRIAFVIPVYNVAPYLKRCLPRWFVDGRPNDIVPEGWVKL